MKINKKNIKTVIIFAAVGFAYFVFVTLTGIAIPCPVRTATGGRVQCPGCGISRLCIRLAHFDLRGAFGCNPVIFSLMPIWAVCVALWLFDRGKKFNKVVVYISIAVLLLYGIIRNIPGMG